MMGKAMPLEVRVRSASRCAMGVRSSGVTAEFDAVRHLTSGGAPCCFGCDPPRSPPVQVPHGWRVEEWGGSHALARELAALGYSNMAHAIEVSIGEVARAERWLRSWV